MLPEPAPRLVRFGLFELDLKTGELRKKGVKIAFQGQPFRVLAMLVSRPGSWSREMNSSERCGPMRCSSILNTG